MKQNDPLSIKLQFYRDEFARLEKLEVALQDENVQYILTTFDEELVDIQREYSMLDAEKPNIGIALADLQGREKQIANHLARFKNIEKRKKELALEIDKLIHLIEEREKSSDSGRRIMSQNIKNEE